MVQSSFTMNFRMFLYVCLLSTLQSISASKNIPIVLTTWEFRSATQNAWQVLNKKGSALDAVEAGAKTCEELQCDGTVGFGGSPDEDGETTLDALLIDGRNLNVGAVAALRRIKSAVSVARHVLEHTSHSILAGELASKFAVEMGFTEEKLNTPTSDKIWYDWKENQCQPNFWTKVKPDPTTSCGPYVADTSSKHMYKKRVINKNNHDTIGTIAIDKFGNIAAGTSTNGAKHKIPGRVGDSPIPGAGAYADNQVGAAAATGDGDVMLRFLPSFLIVEEMRRGVSPTDAAKTAIQRIIQHYPQFMGGVIAVNKRGEYGAACHGLDQFPFVLRHSKLNETMIQKVQCEKL